MLRAFAVPRDPAPLVTAPQLRECHGCGLFQIVPAMAANMRSDCERCGTRLRSTRADPTGHCLALTFASLVLFAILWLAMLMKVSTAGIVHDLGNIIQILSSAVSILDRHPRVRATEGLAPVVSSASTWKAGT